MSSPHNKGLFLYSVPIGWVTLDFVAYLLFTSLWSCSKDKKKYGFEHGPYNQQFWKAVVIFWMGV